MQVALKTYKEFIEAMIPLSLDFSYCWKKRHPDEKLADIIGKMSCLAELLRLDDNEVETLPEWRNFLIRAEEIFSDDIRRGRFEPELTSCLLPFAAGRLDKYYESRAAIAKSYNAGSLKYDAPLAELPRNHCNFHIANMVSPRSFFEDRKYLPRCFMELMDKSEKEYGYDTLRTFTWLNSRPRWLELFPAEWHDNLGEPDSRIVGNLGFWGQLIAADGSINTKVAEYVRQHGELMYKPRSSYCSFTAMRKHLRKYLSEAR